MSCSRCTTLLCSPQAPTADDNPAGHKSGGLQVLPFCSAAPAANELEKLTQMMARSLRPFLCSIQQPVAGAWPISEPGADRPQKVLSRTLRTPGVGRQSQRVRCTVHSSSGNGPKHPLD